jgi:hypothetical protein
MAPGQFSNLAQSDEPAFRVKFDGPPPAQPQLYWRGPVLGAYDGRTWTRLLRAPPGRRRRSRSRSRCAAPPLRYQVTLEPSNTRWLFALEMPQALPQLPGGPPASAANSNSRPSSPVRERIRYDLAPTWTSACRPANAGQRLPVAAAALRPQPAALAAGQRLRRDYPDPAQRVQAVLRQFATGGYVYTLQPPLLGERRRRRIPVRHPRRLLRALRRRLRVPDARGRRAGARGDRLPGRRTESDRRLPHGAPVRRPRLERSLAAARGWVRVDPTAAVAPDRVQRNLAQALPAPAPFGFEGLGRLMQPAPDSLLARVRYAIGAANNGWNQWVLNYTRSASRP